jgi:hypothetical protein
MDHGQAVLETPLTVLVLTPHMGLTAYLLEYGRNH